MIEKSEKRGRPKGVKDKDVRVRDWAVKGSQNRMFKDLVSDEKKREFVQVCLDRAKDNPGMLKFVLEQLYGKATAQEDDKKRQDDALKRYRLPDGFIERVNKLYKKTIRRQEENLAIKEARQEEKEELDMSEEDDDLLVGGAKLSDISRTGFLNMGEKK